MKKYVRLRKECSEFDNALYDASPERLSFRDTATSSDFFRSQSRPPVVLSSPDGSASPPRDSPPAISLARPPRPPAPPTTNGPSHTDLTEALQKLASYREGGSHRQGVASNGVYPRSESERWHDLPDSDSRDPSGSERWQTAETASLSGRWGSVTSTSDAQQHPFCDSRSLSQSGRSEGELWTAAPISLQSSLSGRRVLAVDANDHHHQLAPANISMRETQGWLASVKRPLQQLPKSNAWVDPNEFNWREATTNGRFSSSSSSSRPATVSQSMRYDRLKTSAFDDEEGLGFYHQHTSHSVMQKAASMREGGVHSDAIMAMARAYSEKHGVPHQQAILECVACGRGLGVIVQGNPGNDTSFCNSCRSHAAGGWTHQTNSTLESNKSKRKGMMHYCRKILRIGKKPNKLNPDGLTQSKSSRYNTWSTRNFRNSDN